MFRASRGVFQTYFLWLARPKHALITCGSAFAASRAAAARIQRSLATSRSEDVRGHLGDSRSLTLCNELLRCAAPDQVADHFQQNASSYDVWCHLAALNRIASLDTANGEAKRIAMTHLLVLEHYVASYIGAMSAREVAVLLFLFSRYDHPLPPRLHTLISRQLDRTAPSTAAVKLVSSTAASASAASSHGPTWCSRREASLPGLARIPQASFDAIESVRGGVLQPESSTTSGTGSSSAAPPGSSSTAAARLVARGFFRNQAAAAAAGAGAAQGEASQPLTAATVFGPSGGSSPRAAKGVSHTASSPLLGARLDSLLRHHDVAREVAGAGISAAAAQQLAVSVAAGVQRGAVTGSNIAWALVRQHLFHERALTGLAAEMLGILLPRAHAAAPVLAAANAAAFTSAASSALAAPASGDSLATGGAELSQADTASRVPRLVAGARVMAASLLPQEVLLQLLWALARCGVRAESIIALAAAVAPPLLHRLPPALHHHSQTTMLPVDAAASNAAMQGAQLAAQLLGSGPSLPESRLESGPVHLNYVQQVSALWCYAALGTSSGTGSGSPAGATKGPEAAVASTSAFTSAVMDARLAGAVSALAPSVFDGEALAKVQRTLPVPVRRQLQQAHALLTGGSGGAVSASGDSGRRGAESGALFPGVPTQLPAWLTEGSAAGSTAGSSIIAPAGAAAPTADDAAAAPARARVVRAVQDAFRSLLGLKPVAGLLVEGFRLPLAFPAARLAVDVVMDDATTTPAAASASAKAAGSARFKPSRGASAAAPAATAADSTMAASAPADSVSDAPVRGDATRDAVLAARGWQLVSLSYAQWRRLGTAQQRAQLLQALTHNLPERERAITEARARARSAGSSQPA